MATSSGCGCSGSSTSSSSSGTTSSSSSGTTTTNYTPCPPSSTAQPSTVLTAPSGPTGDSEDDCAEGTSMSVTKVCVDDQQLSSYAQYDQCGTNGLRANRPTPVHIIEIQGAEASATPAEDTATTTTDTTDTTTDTSTTSTCYPIVNSTSETITAAQDSQFNLPLDCITGLCPPLFLLSPGIGVVKVDALNQQTAIVTNLTMQSGLTLIEGTQFYPIPDMQDIFNSWLQDAITAGTVMSGTAHQTLSFDTDSNELTISGDNGNSVSLAGLDVDQTLSFDGGTNELTISGDGGNTVDLSALA